MAMEQCAAPWRIPLTERGSWRLRCACGFSFWGNNIDASDLARYSIRGAGAGQASRLHRHCGADPGAGHRREHGYLLPGQPGPAPALARAEPQRIGGAALSWPNARARLERRRRGAILLISDV